MARFLIIAFVFLAEGCGLSAALQTLRVVAPVAATPPTPTPRRASPAVAETSVDPGTATRVVVAERELAATTEAAAQATARENEAARLDADAASLETRLADLIRESRTPVAGPSPAAVPAPLPTVGDRTLAVRFTAFSRFAGEAQVCVLPPRTTSRRSVRESARCVRWINGGSESATLSFPRAWGPAPQVRLIGGPAFDPQRHRWEGAQCRPFTVTPQRVMDTRHVIYDGIPFC